jgi:hypothetical protein
MKPFLSLAVIAGSIVGLCIASYDPAPKATASPAPIIDHSAELAALKSEISNLKSELAAANLPAAQVAEPDAPAVEGPSAGVLTSTAAFVAYPRVPLARSQSCAGGFCQPAAAPKQYQYQSRSSQPSYRFNGPIARRLQGRR